MKEIRYFIQKQKGQKLLGQMCKTEEEAEKLLPLYKKKGWTKAFIIKRKVELPKPLTEDEKRNLGQFSKGINQALVEVVK